VSDVHESESPTSSPLAQQTEPARDRRKTSSGLLLHRAVKTLGVDVVADALGLSPAVLQRLDAVEKPMNLEQQRTLALAVLVLSDRHPELRRRALALLGQVRASVEFAMGTTERHGGPPPTNRWPERT
jgi:hypothetical protein